MAFNDTERFMAPALSPVTESPESQARVPVRHFALSWLLVLPLIFFAAQGNFSFEYGGSGRSLGLLGYVVLPAIAYGVVAWTLIANGRRILAVCESQKLLLLLACFAIASALWSQNPVRSAYNGLFLLLNTLFAFYLFLRFRPERLMELIMLAGAVILTLSLITVFAFPNVGRSFTPRVYGAWVGIFMDRTSSASVCVFLLSPAIVFWRRGLNWGRVAYMVLLLVSIWKAQAATALVVVLAYVMTVLLIRVSARLDRKSLLVLSVIALPVVVAAIIVVPPYVPVILKGLGRDPTLTGRTEIWASLLRSVAKRPLLGYGYYAFWNGLSGESANAIIAAQWVFGYAHNGFLEIILQLGFAGLLLFSLTLVQALRNAWICYREDRSPGTLWFTSLIFLTLFYNVSEETIAWPNSLRSILYVVACCGLARAAREVRSQRRSGSCELTMAFDRASAPLAV